MNNKGIFNGERQENMNFAQWNARNPFPPSSQNKNLTINVNVLDKRQFYQRKSSEYNEIQNTFNVNKTFNFSLKMKRVFKNLKKR